MIIFWATLIGLSILAILFTAPLWRHRNYALAFLSVLAIPTLAFGLYSQLGNPSKLNHYYKQLARQDEIKRQLQKYRQPEDVIHELEHYTQNHPKDAHAWYLLGKLYLLNNNPNKAVQALKKAHSLKPKNNKIKLIYAQALYANNNKQLNKQSEQLLQEIVQTNPETVDAWHLLAINAYRQQNYKKAVSYWQNMLPYLKKPSPQRAYVLKMIAKAQNQKAN